MQKQFMLAAIAAISLANLSGCSEPQQPAAPMAPPMQQTAQMAPPVNGGMNGNLQGGVPQQGGAPQQGGVYNWQDVPVNKQVGIVRAQFDQGGYQMVAGTGETIVVPFVNQNLYVMRFGRSSAQTYFVNENGVPTLYLAPGAGLANASAQGALWYPIPNDFNYSQPMYVGMAANWNDYVGMGWYPGMAVYGGMWGYNPYHYSWMPGFMINIGGARYTTWGGYTSYYSSHPGYYRTAVVYHNYNTGLRGPGAYRSTGAVRSGAGSFGRTSSAFNGGSAPHGSFGTGARFGGSVGSAGSFGTGTRAFNPSGSSFARPSGSSSFGRGFTQPFGSGGGGRSSGGSFLGGARSFGGGGRRR